LLSDNGTRAIRDNLYMEMVKAEAM